MSARITKVWPAPQLHGLGAISRNKAFFTIIGTVLKVVRKFLIKKPMKKTLLFLAVSIWPMFLFGQTVWKQTSATTVFIIKSGGNEVTGTIKSVNASLVFSGDKLAASSVRMVGDVATLTTGNPKRDATLQGENHFNTAKYPTMEISSTTLTKNNEHYTGVFNVTIKGVTKQLEIPFEFTEAGNNAEFNCNFIISRKEFQLGRKGLSNLFLSDKVRVTIGVKASS
jgi:polyisoprenoid-binding protein YceI